MMVLPRIPSFLLEGRWALVTGGSKGIGLAAAAALVQSGAHVTIAARSAAELADAREALLADRQQPGQCVQSCLLDVTDAAAVRRLVAEQAAVQPFDILVNNAGMNRPSLITEQSDADIDSVLALNVKAALQVAREVVRALLASGRPGTIIKITKTVAIIMKATSPLSTVSLTASAAAGAASAAGAAAGAAAASGAATTAAAGAASAAGAV